MGANPVDRGKPGSKLHLVCDGGGLPLTAAVTAANVADTTMFQALLDDLPPIRAPSGRRRSRPGKVHADKAGVLGVRWDRDAGRWFAFVLVACAVICFNRL